jgi:SAM-dependent methyltransferase
MKVSNNLASCPICAETGTSVPHWQTPCFRRCERCGALFRDPFPSEAQLSRLYQSSWADLDAHLDETGGTDLEFGRRMLVALLRELDRRNFSSQHILDFGAGRGGMSLALREMGAQVAAVEPFGYEQLRQLDLPTYLDLDELPAEPQFDGIVLIEVIEHLRDPCDLLRRLDLRLKPGGWFFVTTPNPRGLAAMLHGQRWRSASNAGHILFFTARTLRRTLSELGFIKVQQTQWVIRFPNVSPARAMVQSALQLLHLGGGLRFLAVKA